MRCWRRCLSLAGYVDHLDDTGPDRRCQPTMRLAVDTYAGMAMPADRSDRLNLAWTLDERACLSADVSGIVARELKRELGSGLEYVTRYLVDDPYGSALLGPAVASLHARGAEGCTVFSGAGVISLLQALSMLAGAAGAYVIGDTYPDFPYWVESAGSRCHPHPGELSLEEHAVAVSRSGAAIVFLERPSLLGDATDQLAGVQSLCERVAAAGALVVIDESNANYCPPGFTAIQLLPQVTNLVILRGLSKAYGMGGLRLGYCIAADDLSERLRRVIPPLLASSLSLRLGAVLLALGDIAAPLRERIAERKGVVLELLEARGLRDAKFASRYLPYLLTPMDSDNRELLERAGVFGKQHSVWSGATTQGEYLYRLSVPLSDRRLALLRTLLRTLPTSR